ncbi:MAG: hypothetical protein J7L38_00860 [Thermoproteales archaeon]|nr:hypothetical protein [Thermoproteales archaeon]RLE66827.1 MAG: hypothetical protein DRJ47_01540 [Thermoprotei archaeon]
MELESKEDFLKLALKTDLIFRIDPFLIINYYGVFMYLDLRRLGDGEVKSLLYSLKDKIINIRRHLKAGSISQLLEE